MKQLPIEWIEEPDLTRTPEIDLPPQTIETVVVLMARALLAIVQASEEASEEASDDC